MSSKRPLPIEDGDGDPASSKKQRTCECCTDDPTAFNCLRIHLTEDLKSWVDLALSLPIAARLTKAEFEVLWDLHPPERGRVRVYGKHLQTPRWQEVYGHDYTFSGVKHPGLEYPVIIQRLLNFCRNHIDPRFNGAVVNWYKDGQDSISPHADDEPGIIPGSPIASLSFGAQREFVFHKKDPARDRSSRPEKRVFTLTNNTLLVMGGTTQTTHKHSVPKDPKCTTKRINVTFRCFDDDKDDQEKKKKK